MRRVATSADDLVAKICAIRKLEDIYTFADSIELAIPEGYNSINSARNFCVRTIRELANERRWGQRLYEEQVRSQAAEQRIRELQERMRQLSLREVQMVQKCSDMQMKLTQSQRSELQSLRAQQQQAAILQSYTGNGGAEAARRVAAHKAEEVVTLATNVHKKTQLPRQPHTTQKTKSASPRRSDGFHLRTKLGRKLRDRHGFTQLRKQMRALSIDVHTKGKDEEVNTTKGDV